MLAISRRAEGHARESALPPKADMAAVGRESPQLTKADIGILPFSDFALARRAASRGGLFAVLADEDVGGAVDVEVADHECRRGIVVRGIVPSRQF